MPPLHRPWQPSWVLPGATVDLDFRLGRYFQRGVGSGVDLMTCSRASEEYADALAGVWLPMPSNSPAMTDRGLAGWESRTNSIRNGAASGAVVGIIGAGGAAPTNWSVVAIGNAGTLAWQVIGAGVEDGIDYVDLRLFGTPTGAGFAQMLFETSTAIVAASGQTWSASFFGYMLSGSMTNIAGQALFINEYTSAGVYVTNGGSAALSLNGTRLGASRFKFVRTLSGGATVARTASAFAFNYVAGLVDITFRVGGTQLEQGAFVTPPIRTTSAAVTRNADSLALRVLPYRLIAAGGFTAYAEFTPGQVTASEAAIFSARLDSSNLVEVYHSATRYRAMDIRGGVTGDANSGVAPAVGTKAKIAATILPGSTRISVGGAAVVSAAQSSAIPAFTSAPVLGAGSGTLAASGVLQRLAITAPLSDAQMQALST